MINDLPFIPYVLTHAGRPTDVGDLATLVEARHCPSWVVSLPRLLDWLDEQAAPSCLREAAREAHRLWVTRGQG